MIEADNTSNPIIQVSLPRPRFTNHLVICPAAWMTSKLQKPSASWNNGVEYLSMTSQVPTVIISKRPPEPNIHSLIPVSCARFRSNVLATQSPLAFASTANRFMLHINSPGNIIHCAMPIICIKAHRILDSSGVASLRVE